MSRYDVALNTTLELTELQEQEITDEYRDWAGIGEHEEDPNIEDVIEWYVEQEPPQDLGFGLTGATWFAVATERVTFLD